jgi:SAM-dependent methyltransferase
MNQKQGENNAYQTVIEGDNYLGKLDDSVKDAMGVFKDYRSTTISYKKEYVKLILQDFYPKTVKNILDFGCGTGIYTKLLKEILPDTNIFGCDISKEGINLARQNVPDCTFDTIVDQADLSGKYGQVFDFVFINCVFHHIPHCEHVSWLQAIKSITKSNGIIIIFEMNPYHPLVKVLQKKNKLMEENAVLLKPKYCKDIVNSVFTNRRLAYTFLSPWRKKFFVGVEHACAKLPLGAQYYVTAINNDTEKNVTG